MLDFWVPTIASALTAAVIRFLMFLGLAPELRSSYSKNLLKSSKNFILCSCSLSAAVTFVFGVTTICLASKLGENSGALFLSLISTVLGTIFSSFSYQPVFLREMGEQVRVSPAETEDVEREDGKFQAAWKVRERLNWDQEAREKAEGYVGAVPGSKDSLTLAGEVFEKRVRDVFSKKDVEEFMTWSETFFED